MSSNTIEAVTLRATPSVRRYGMLLGMIAFVAVVVVAARYFPMLSSWPAEWNVPARAWVSTFFEWLSETARPVTRAVSWLISKPLSLVEGLLFRGFPAMQLGPLPWIAVVGLSTTVGHWAGGIKLAAFCGICTLYLAIFGVWRDAMETLSIVVVAVPLAAALGLALGIWATRNARASSILNATFDVMQATPHMAYLAPVIVMFGFGQVPALIASLIFAVPPMARCTILGIKTVPQDVTESGLMVGCTPLQMLWKVELPSAQRTILLGLNQVVMQVLAMAVITSLVGASGLGQKLLYSLQQLQIGRAVEQGVAITLIAIVLDRTTRAVMTRVPSHLDVHKSWAMRHRHLITFFCVLLAASLLARKFPLFSILPSDMTLNYGAPIDYSVRWMARNLFDYIKPVRNWITIWMLLPLRDFYLWLPWPIFIGFLAVLGYHLGGLRLALLPVFLLSFLMVTGFWTPLMLTIYLVTSATVLCIIIGIPIGIWASKRSLVARIVNGACDVFQTFPSFIYLIPVIMLFQTSDLSNVLAMLAYATVPAIRYTYLGLSRVPVSTVEAATASGATPWQRLRKVELPIAFPEILLGINQTIMMALAMVAITALIGSRDLGQEVYKALPGADIGRGLLAGLGIAFIGIIADRLISAWASRRKAELGIV